MSYEIRTRQARCAALGFWPGPIDGINGPRTQAAYEAAVTSQEAKGLPFIHPTGLSRIHLHWTGGGHEANATDRASYHVLIQGGGSVIYAAPPTERRSHTLNANGGAIGVSMCCMAGAVERPFSWGRAPMTSAQLDAMALEVARLSRQYDIPVSRYSILTHAEVQPTLGIRQRFKWDVNVLPWMTAPEDPITVGDRIRSLIAIQHRSV
jgi:hypothetical protein